MSDTPTLVDTAEIAKMLALSEAAVRRLARLGVLPCYQVNRLYRFSPAEVLASMRAEVVSPNSDSDLTELEMLRNQRDSA